MTQPIVAIILAAGRSTRMGAPKQTLPWGNRFVLAETLVQLLASEIDEAILITGHLPAQIAAIGAQFGIASRFNPDYQTSEMLSSLQVGLRALPPDTAAILVVLGDQPMIPATVYNALIATFKAGEGDIIAPTFAGKRGNPVLFGANYFQALLDLPANAAPRHLLAQHPDAVTLLPVSTEAILFDLDTPTQYMQLHRRFFGRKPAIDIGRGDEDE